MPGSCAPSSPDSESAMGIASLLLILCRALSAVLVPSSCYGGLRVLAIRKVTVLVRGSIVAGF
jgi:hypothetical protein